MIASVRAAREREDELAKRTTAVVAAARKWNAARHRYFEALADRDPIVRRIELASDVERALIEMTNAIDHLETFT